MDKILKFKLWGDYAHFKKYYTTTSPLTFEFPPPPTIIGIISAIIGLDKKDNFYLTKFLENNYNITLKLNNPVRKVRWTQNLIDTKHHFWRIKNRTQIRIELLKKPSFTIYFWHQNYEIYKALKQHLENHTSIYSISLGLSELLANFEYLGEENLSEIPNGQFIQIDSVIPSKHISEKGIDYEIGKEIFQVNFPIFMNPERIVEKRAEIIFERNAKSIRCSPMSYWQLENGEKIVFF